MFTPKNGRNRKIVAVVVALAVIGALASAALAAGIPAPIITSHPTLVTTSRTATFKYYDTYRQPLFACSLDKSSPKDFVPCFGGMWYDSHVHAAHTYKNLKSGKHTFRLFVAVSRSGPVSKTVTFTWTVK
jgi:hypothetical protein